MRGRPFLDEIAAQIKENAKEYSFLTIILPSKRVIRDLKLRFSAESGDNAMWMPGFTTMEDFAFKSSCMSKAEPLEIALILYDCYVEVTKAAGKEYRSYADFAEWGSMLLSDFHQLDAQLSPVSDILSYVSEEKRISGMEFDLSEKSEIQNAYLSFYSLLFPIYKAFTERIREKGIVYAGLAERIALEKLKEAETKENLGKEFFMFAGFNAITHAEESIMRLLVKAGKAEVYWDADSYYVDDSMQEAGLFLRRYKADPQLGKYIDEEHLTATLPCSDPSIKTGEILALPQQIGQVEMAGFYLHKWYVEEMFTGRTAVVLNDETLLMPLLNALPQGPEYNISVGASLKGCAVHCLVDCLLKGREEADLNAVLGERTISIKTLVSLWRSEIWTICMGRTENEVELKTIFKENKGFFNEKEWAKVGLLFNCADRPLWILVNELFFRLESENKELFDSVDYLNYLERILFTVAQVWTMEEMPKYEREYIRQAMEYIERDRKIRKSYRHIFVPFYLWRKQCMAVLLSLAVNYKGNPLAKVQIIGMLETRMLDFDRVIMLSVNEGLLPSSQFDGSFLLDSVKKHCNIPTGEEKNAMQAYYFYRLIAFSKKTVWLYAQNDKLEKSRFLWQLEYEKPLPLVKGAEYPYPITRIKRSKGIQINKSEQTLKILLDKIEYGLSPTALSTYLSCKLQFYFKYVLGIGDIVEFDDTLNAIRKGTAIHKVLELFFGARKNILLTKDDVKGYKKEYKKLLGEALFEEFGSHSYDFGKNGIETKKMEQWLRYFGNSFEHDMLENSDNWTRVIDCEKEVDCNIDIQDLPVKAKLLGTVDRLDAVGVSVRVVDYKTGVVEKRDLEISSIEDFADPNRGKALQLLLYSYMYWVEHGRKEGSFPKACIYSMSKLDQSYTYLQGKWVENLTESNKIEEIETFLSKIILQICDPKESFTQNLNSCTYCQYKDLCGI